LIGFLPDRDTCVSHSSRKRANAARCSGSGIRPMMHMRINPKC
jgi:hypothetical protein